MKIQSRESYKILLLGRKKNEKNVIVFNMKYIQIKNMISFYKAEYCSSEEEPNFYWKILILNSKPFTQISL